VEDAPVHASDLHVLRGRYASATTYACQVPVTPTVITRCPSAGLLMQTMRALVARGIGEPSEMLKLSPLTALLLVTDELDVRPGEWLLQTAAGSTVGKLVVQLGTHFGFKTMNVVRRRSAVDEIRELGGTAVICAEDEDLRTRVAEIAGEQGVAKAIDCVSGQVGADVSRALAPGGEMIVYGALATHRQTDADKLTIPLFARSMIYETKTVRGFWLYRWFTTTPQDQIRAALKRTFDLVAGGTLQVPEGQPINVEQFAEAVRLAEAPAHGGKPLLVFQG
jgi:NADPH:quinone reductase-like Zn-dependent oxidoreductase